MDDHHSNNDSRNAPGEQVDFETSNDLPHSTTILEEQEENQSNNNTDANNKSKSSMHDNISQEFIPRLGMEFDSEEEAYDFYNRYANKVGFSIRRNKGHKDESSGRGLDRTFCCSREGDRRVDNRCDNVRLPRPETRCGCGAMLKINVQHNLNFKLRVEKFISEHKHELVATPSKRIFLRSQRRINSAQAAELEIASESGIPPKLSVEFMAKKAGGYENLSYFIQVDIDDTINNFSRFVEEDIP